MATKKKSFFERLTGSVSDDDFEELDIVETEEDEEANMGTWMKEEAEEAELTVDVYQTPHDIIIQAMVAGVKPEHLELTIARDMVTIKGKREESKVIEDDNFFVKELYWGTFSRTLLLPQEVEPEEAEATEKHGLLTIKLPKIDKEKKRSVKVKSV
jgi:HSP20 family protein